MQWLCHPFEFRWVKSHTIASSTVLQQGWILFDCVLSWIRCPFSQSIKTSRSKEGQGWKTIIWCGSKNRVNPGEEGGNAFSFSLIAKQQAQGENVYSYSVLLSQFLKEKKAFSCQMGWIYSFFQCDNNSIYRNNNLYPIKCRFGATWWCWGCLTALRCQVWFPIQTAPEVFPI